MLVGGVGWGVGWGVSQNKQTNNAFSLPDSIFSNLEIVDYSVHFREDKLQHGEARLLLEMVETGLYPRQTLRLPINYSVNAYSAQCTVYSA